MDLQNNALIGVADMTFTGPGDADHLPDGLHPDGDGYITLGQRFARFEFGAGGRLLPGRFMNSGL